MNAQEMSERIRRERVQRLQNLRRGSAARPPRNKARYSRKAKHTGRRYE